MWGKKSYWLKREVKTVYAVFFSVSERGHEKQMSSESVVVRFKKANT